MTLARDVIAQLRAELTRTASARDGTARARDTAAEMQVEVQAAADGSTDSRPAEAIMRLEQAQVRLDEAAAELAAGDAAVEAYIAELEGGGSGSPPDTSAPTAQRPTPVPVPAAVRRAADRVPAWQPRSPTRGLAWLDEDGEPVAFESGRDRSARDGLLPQFASRVVTTDHVEGKLAARMRQPSGPVNVTTVINKDPCGGPIGCDATLPHIMPPNSTISIYVRDADGVRHYKTYHGTGEGMA